VLWPCLIGLLGKTLKKEDMAKASMVMGTTVATGTLVIYALSSLFALIDSFKLAFFTPAIVVPIVALVWLFSFEKLTKKTEGDDGSLDEMAGVKEEKIQKGEGQGLVEKKKMPKDILMMICVMGVFAVATNLVADGLTTWVPSILKETYGLDDSLSILLTLCLPLLAIFGNMFALKLYKRTNNFVASCATLFFFAGLLILAIIGLLSTQIFILTILCFAFVRFLAGSSNSTITSITPLFLKGKVEPGRIAGLLNGCCYAGSTISSYGLGVIADQHGWNSVFYLLFAVCLFVVLLACVYAFILRLKAKKVKAE
jgi:OPA family glycerol-3-phosphate transporter-like MFS transporter